MRASILLLAAFFCMSAPAFARFDSDCHALKLKGAASVPQDKANKYSFLGTCNIIFVHSNGDVEALATIPAEAQGEWDGSKLQFSESFQILANDHYPGADESN